MYQKFFGLNERPFDLTANPKYLFLTGSHREALSNLDYGIRARTGLTVLLGEAGTGKTTLIRAMLDSHDACQRRLVYLNNPTLTRVEFFEFLAREFGLGLQAATSKSALLIELESLLRQPSDNGPPAALIIDEAQSLPHELLEEIRLLANIETPTEKLLPVVLAGQPELADRLNQPALRQLKQRVGLRCELRPLDLRETAAFITARIEVAGGIASRLFTREAVMLIHQRSLGIPRTISVICNNALISGFALNRRPVGTDVVREVCRDFDLNEMPAPVPQLAVVRSPAKDAVTPAAARVDPEQPRTADNGTKDLFTDIAGSRRRFSFF